MFRAALLIFLPVSFIAAFFFGPDLQVFLSPTYQKVAIVAFAMYQHFVKYPMNAKVVIVDLLTYLECTGWTLGKSFCQRTILIEIKINKNMYTAVQVALLTSFLFALYWTSTSGLFIPNLTDGCYRCLCYVSTSCAISNDCQGGYCGPFNISRVYWVDSGKIVLEEDDPDRNNAWKDCARNYHCSRRIIEGYLQKFGRDCNDDGVTDCYDYMLINGNGAYGCTSPLNTSIKGRGWLQRYEECRSSRLLD